MKISELIKELQSHQDEFGDLDVYRTNDYGFISLIRSVYYNNIPTNKQGNPFRVVIVVES